jgi:hypothetical protein
MTVLPSPGGADHPIQSGVRLGNHQPRRNSRLAVCPGAMRVCPVRIADDPLRFRLQLTFAWLSQTHGMIAK